MKVHSFSKLDMSNRNHERAVFSGLYEKYEQFQILRDIGYVNYLLFSRAFNLHFRAKKERCLNSLWIKAAESI